MRTELEALFQRFRANGDVDALAAVFDQSAARLYQIARHLVRRRDGAEDLVQSTFLTAIERASNWDEERPLLPWLVGILVNHARSAKRKDAAVIEPEDLARATAVDPSRNAEAEEFARLLAAAIEKLPDTYRPVIASYLAEGEQPHEIAVRLRRPSGTVRAQLHRGLRLLREALPAGLSLGLALLHLSRPPLARARERVLDVARERAAGRPTAALTQSASAVRKTVWATAAGLAFVCAGLWWAAARAPATDAAPSVAGNAAQPTKLELQEQDAERTERVATLTPEVVPAAPATAPSAFGSLRIRARYGDGVPAAGVGLKLMAFGDPAWEDNQKEVVTDAGGAAFFDAIHPGRVALKADRGGEARAQVRPGEEALLEWRVGGEIHVFGVVVDPERRPVPGASITLSYENAGLTSRAALVCDGDGRFAIDHCAAYQVVGAIAPGYAPADRVWIGTPVHLITRRAELELCLRPSTGRIAGTVRDAQGRTVARPEIRIEPALPWPQQVQPDGAITLSTPLVRTTGGEDGHFEVRDLREGTYRVLVVARGFGEWEGIAHADESGAHDLDVRLNRSARVAGKLARPDGSPAAGARVSANANCVLGPAEIAVGDDGRYSIEGVASGVVHMYATVGGEGMLPLEADLLAEPGEALTWNAQFQPALELSGRLVDERGTPLAGWWVRAVSASGARCASARDWLRYGAPWASRRLSEWLQQKPVAADGSFRSNAVAPGLYALEVYSPTARTEPPIACFRGLEAGTNDLRFSVDTSAHAAATLRGRLSRADGRAIEHGSVLVRFAAHGGERRGAIEAGGAFEIGPLPGGDVELFAWGPGLPIVPLGARTLSAGEVNDTGVLTIAAPGAALIQLARDAGGNLAGVDVSLSSRAGWSAAPRRLAGDRWRADDLRPGLWLAEIRARGRESRALELEIRSGETTLVEATLRSGTTRRIEVVPPAVPPDAPRGGRELDCEIRADTTGVLVARREIDPLDPSTLVLYEGLAPGLYRVSASDNAGRERAGSFEVQPGDSSARPIRTYLK